MYFHVSSWRTDTYVDMQGCTSSVHVYASRVSRYLSWLLRCTLHHNSCSLCSYQYGNRYNFESSASQWRCSTSLQNSSTSGYTALYMYQLLDELRSAFAGWTSAHKRDTSQWLPTEHELEIRFRAAVHCMIVIEIIYESAVRESASYAIAYALYAQVVYMIIEQNAPCTRESRLRWYDCLRDSVTKLRRSSVGKEMPDLRDPDNCCNKWHSSHYFKILSSSSLKPCSD